MLQMISKMILLTKQHMVCLVHRLFSAAVGDIVWDPLDKRCYININAEVFQQFVSPTKAPRLAAYLTQLLITSTIFIITVFKKSIQHINYYYRFSDIFPLKWEWNPNDYLPVWVVNFYLLALPLQFQLDIIWFLPPLKNNANAAIYY